MRHFPDVAYVGRPSATKIWVFVSGMLQRRSFYELVVRKFPGRGVGESIWLLGKKTWRSGVLHDGL